ncbi:MAG: hypothetical protein HFE62_02090 [Firmicutes bacterium]|nr:hypothetical protein [Bacillota bacterium]
MDIYVKPVKKFKAEGKKIVYLKDIAEVFCGDIKNDSVKNAVVLRIESNEERKNYLISAMDIVKAIVHVEPNATVINIGETDVMVEYSKKPRKENKFFVWIKVFAIFVVLFFGGATAIMSFHADGEIPDVMRSYFELFYGYETDIPYILEIPYSIGLAVGIIVFFNHFSVIKMTHDPTPIQVQMTTYEKEVIENQIETINKKREN